MSFGDAVDDDLAPERRADRDEVDDPQDRPVQILGVDLSRSRDYPDCWCGGVVDAVVAGGLVAMQGPPGSA